MKKKKFYKLMKKIPKAELHIHAEAVVSKKLVGKLLSRGGNNLLTENEIDRLFVYNDLPEFVNVFLSIQRAFSIPEDFAKLFQDVVLYLRKNGITYAELFLSPSSFTKNGLYYDDILNAFLKKIKKTEKKYGIRIRLIIDVSRTFGVENALNNLQKTLMYDSKYIIGIGLGGDEVKGPAENFADVFKKAHKKGLHCVAHAGESVGPESIWNAIKKLHAERIGHGLTTFQDPDLGRYLKKEDIPLEVCPTSNYVLGYVSSIEEHPVREYIKKGIPVTINTDDPTFFSVNLIDEYWNLYSKLHIPLKEIKKIVINGFKYSFLSPKKRKKYIKKVKSAWKKHFSDK